MSSQLLFVLTGLCGLGFLATLAWAFGALGRARSVGAGFWICTLLSLAGTGLALAAGLRASSVLGTVEALHALPVISASEADKAPVGEAVALQGVAKATASARVAGRRPAAVPAPASADPADAGNGLLAVEVHYEGEDEFEGEENDYVREVDYGRETDVAPFSLAGAPGAKPLLVDDDGFKVLAAHSGEVRSVDTNEFSPVVNRNLMERETKVSIADGATITVSGVVVDQGGQRVLMSLGPSLSLITDRPWATVLAEAQAKGAEGRVNFFLSFALAIFGFGALLVARRFTA